MDFNHFIRIRISVFLITLTFERFKFILFGWGVAGNRKYLRGVQGSPDGNEDVLKLEKVSP